MTGACMVSLICRGLTPRWRCVSGIGAASLRSASTVSEQIDPTEMRRDLRDLVLYSTQFSVYYKKLKDSKDAVEDKMAKLNLNPTSLSFNKDTRCDSKRFDNVVPVALQYMNHVQPVPEVQSDKTQMNDKEIVVEEQEPYYPYSSYDPVESKEPGPKDEPSKRLGRRGRRRTEENLPSAGAGNELEVDGREFEVIKDDLGPEEAKEMLEDDHYFKYGTADPTVPTSNVPCGGCGAHLHCNDVKLPGFTPLEIFGDGNKFHLRQSLCQRCYVMKNYDLSLKVMISPEDYPKTIGHLKTKPAIILLVVDLVDFPGSVWPNLVDVLGPDKVIFLIGNKADLLPQDSAKYLRRVERSMKQNFLAKCRREGIKDIPYIMNTLLVSARTGFNIEILIDKLFTVWKSGKAYSDLDMYIVGTTNVGKSSIFNVLLDSDLCKHSALHRVEKAMTSPVPGTTLNLLKFPLSRPDPSRLAWRHMRLERSREVFKQVERMRIQQLRETKDRAYSIISSPVELTSHRADKQTVFKSTHFNFDPQIQRQRKEEEKPTKLNLDSAKMAKNKWCFDTPGSVSSDQIINLLTQEEIRLTLPTDLPILPRTYLMMVGQTLFIAGLARFDVLECSEGEKKKLLVTVFTSDQLPINIVKTENADEFYSRALGSDLLMVPRGGIERLNDFPELKSKEMTVDGVSRYESSCDVVLSSAGWISCSPKVAHLYKIKAWTPDGKGIFLRDPPFLPEAVNLKGDIIKGSPAYANNKVFIPPE